MRPRRKAEGFNLAFLDIMSCGLGAIVLVFMLVKHNVENSSLETDLLQADLLRLEQQQAALNADIADARQRQADTEAGIAGVSAAIEQARAALQAAADQASAERSQKSALEETIRTLEIPETPDIVQTPAGGEETYLIGLRVEGPRIGILVDASASMTDEILIDVIKRKNSSVAAKRAGPKWQRTKEIVRWLVARVPEDSAVTAIGFSRTATAIGDGGWISGQDAAGVGRIVAGLEEIVPEGATNLQAGLDAMARTGATNIYLITDGLPTDGDSGYRSLNPFADCSALWGGSSKISGACRSKLFRHTVVNASLNGAVVNVILLPIEGDPYAADHYWRWASATRGLMISPAATWP